MTTPPFTPDQSQQGFTLVELLITIGVLSILLGVAAMTLLPWLRAQQVRTDISELAADFNLYRTKTLSEGQVYRITLSTDRYVVERQLTKTTWATAETYVFRRARLNLSSVATQYVFLTTGILEAAQNNVMSSNTTVVGSDGKTSVALRVTALGFTRIL
ncbi:pilus assembly FimT family protein [Deinococcus aquaedulcis]|uniref:pilus assembly FimT family protein n=1 Tax=Deinococcus aquaedulcis TaxID=2840455 RepID=UPI001C82EEFA|nr:prepilin-type N-terminal cleavage/methylation domain-containing protein [Deinococcus aquaedulcis]